MKTILFLFVLFSLSSCSTINKLFHKNKSVIDSTSVTHERKDSVVTKDSLAVHKSKTENTDEIVFDFGDTKMVLPFIKDSVFDKGIYYYPKNTNDYFEISPTGIKTNMPLKRVTIKGKSVTDNSDSLADHSKIDKSEASGSDTHVAKKEKEVVKEVHKKKTFLWWLLLLIPVYIFYRNWPRIKAIALHFITGL